MKFIHIITNCNHAVSLGYFLSKLKKKDEHHVLIDPIRNHSDDFFALVKGQFPHTFWLEDSIDFNADDIVIFHGLFSQNAKILLYKIINSPIKTAWSIWGGDAALLAKTQALELLNQLDYVICAPGETLPFPQFSVPEVNACLYIPPPISHQKRNKENLIVLGNSGNPSNNHAYLFGLAKKFKDAKFHIPFAYNGNNSYLEELCGLCKELGIFEKVYFQMENLSLNAYYDLFNRAKVFLAAHDRQQALGTMQIAYRCGCKVFLKKTITLSDNKTAINPSYLTLQMLGYPDVNDITSLENSVGQISLDHVNDNLMHELCFGTPEHNERVFNILKRK